MAYGSLFACLFYACVCFLCDVLCDVVCVVVVFCVCVFMCFVGDFL